MPDGDQTEKILVADDDRVERTLMQHNLEKAGYAVIAVENGKEVLAHMSQEIGAVLLDLYMPEMDGITCLRHLRSLWPDLSPIMITASEDVSDAVEAMKYGAFDYLIKPVKTSGLLPLLEKVLQNRRQARRLRKVEAELLRAKEREMDVAAKIQRILLMGKTPDNIPGAEIAHLTIPSRKVDGDFFDFFRISDHCLDIIVGDVMGKGIASALLGAAVKSHLLRAISELTIHALTGAKTAMPEPAEIVSRVHSAMIRHLEEIETFVTLCYARIDLEKRTFCFVDCGHMRIIHHRSTSQSIRLLEGVNMPLGLPETLDFEQMSLAFDSGDLFLFYSDGLTETRNPEGEMYGEKRLADFVRANADCHPEKLVDQIRRELVQYSHSAEFGDDFTCVAAAIK
ncbi:MAG: SpoIIE family protein phosphatase [Desulfobacterales bacterium]